LVLDAIASPGAGKTTPLERTIERLKDELRIAVIEGDPTSSLDTDRVGPRARQQCRSTPAVVATSTPA
jgi:Ni2+-binding GTPase involved in maturation of urease and hydrogenase